MVGAKKGGEVTGGGLIEMCHDAGAPQCAAFAAANAVRMRDGAGVVAMAMATEEGSPVGFMVLDCIHDVELVVKSLRAAAKDAFEGQPCTKCES